MLNSINLHYFYDDLFFTSSSYFGDKFLVISVLGWMEMSAKVITENPQIQEPQLSSIYGPVNSWRFGSSLGIDPIGLVSTCSFNCVYCQLGTIQNHTSQRQIFIPTTQIIQDLQAIGNVKIDVVTLSGSGEPTLALNLGEILAAVKKITNRPTVVLTNSTLLGDRTVRNALALADYVSAKLDAISSNQLQRVSRPVATIDLSDIIAGIKLFRREYPGHLAIQTMVLSPWTPEIASDYIEIVKDINPNEIQLNVPSRPRVLVRHLEARGNEIMTSDAEILQQIKCISGDFLTSLAAQIYDSTKIPVRCAPMTRYIND